MASLNGTFSFNNTFIDATLVLIGLDGIPVVKASIKIGLDGIA